jgi:hypothetical protein
VRRVLLPHSAASAHAWALAVLPWHFFPFGAADGLLARALRFHALDDALISYARIPLCLRLGLNAFAELLTLVRAQRSQHQVQQPGYAHVSACSERPPR